MKIGYQCRCGYRLKLIDAKLAIAWFKKNPNCPACGRKFVVPFVRRKNNTKEKKGKKS